MQGGVPFSDFEDGGGLIANDKIVGLRAGVNTQFDAAISEETVSISQVAHGFVGNEVVRLNGGIFVTAQANNAANAESVGMVSAITDANTFVLQLSGLFTDLIGLTPGDTYFLDPAVAGGLTNVDPAIAAVAGTVSKPMLIAYTATSGFLFNWRGQVL